MRRLLVGSKLFPYMNSQHLSSRKSRSIDFDVNIWNMYSFDTSAFFCLYLGQKGTDLEITQKIPQKIKRYTSFLQQDLHILLKKMLTKVTSGVLGLVMLAAEVGFQTFCISTQTVYTTRRTQACWNWTGHIIWVNVPTLSQGINFQWFTQRFGQSFILFCVWHFSAIQYAKWRKWGLGFRAILWLFYFS